MIGRLQLRYKPFELESHYPSTRQPPSSREEREKQHSSSLFYASTKKTSGRTFWMAPLRKYYAPEVAGGLSPVLDATRELQPERRSKLPLNPKDQGV